MILDKISRRYLKGKKKGLRAKQLEGIWELKETDVRGKVNE